MLTLEAKVFQGSPLFEGYLASVIFFGKGLYSLVAVCRIMTDAESVTEVQVGSQEQTCQSNGIEMMLARNSLLIRLDKPLVLPGSHEMEIFVSFVLTDQEYGLLKTSLLAILSDGHGALTEA
jgi:hypothetical protein